MLSKTYLFAYDFFVHHVNQRKVPCSGAKSRPLLKVVGWGRVRLHCSSRGECKSRTGNLFSGSKEVKGGTHLLNIILPSFPGNELIGNS